MIYILILTHLRAINCFLLKPQKLIFDFNFFSTGINNSCENTEVNATLGNWVGKSLLRLFGRTLSMKLRCLKLTDSYYSLQMLVMCFLIFQKNGSAINSLNAWMQPISHQI